MTRRDRREREKLERVALIKKAAKKVLFRRGFFQATMEEIADVAEVAKGTIYLYFKSKEDLACSIALDGLDILISKFSEATTHGLPADEELRAIGSAYYEFYRDHPDYFRTFCSLDQPDLHANLSDEMCREIDSRGEACIDIVARAVERGVEEQIFRADINAKETALLLWTSEMGMIQLIGGNETHLEEWAGVPLESLVLKAGEFILRAIRADGGD